MALLFADGMDLIGATANIVRRYDSITASVAWGAAFGRFGGGGIKVTDDDRLFSKSVAGSPQTCIVSFALFRSSTASQIDRCFGFDTSVSQGGIQMFTNSASSLIQVRRGATVLGVDFTVSLNVWHWISIKYKAANIGGTYDVKVDGTNVFSFTGDTVNSGTETINIIKFGGDQTQDFTYDDIIIMDDTGSAPFNDFLADTRIDTIQPNAVGDNAGFTAVPAVANHLNVDEAVPDDDTTYVESEVTTTKDLYNMASMAFSPTAINAIQVVGQVTNPDSGTTQFKFKVKSGITEGTGIAKSPPLGYTFFDEIFINNPDTAAAWTESEVNAMQAGMEIV